MKLNELTIVQLHKGLQGKEFSATEVSRAHFAAIKEKDGGIFSFLSLNEKEALTQAETIDKRIAAHEEIPVLAGIPAAIKDNILIEGLPCTASSKILEDYKAPYDATVVEKLKQQGVVFLGKTNLDEFAMGSSTENSAFGTTKNPYDTSRVPGGSSGGSAAAVAAHLAAFSLGSDTGGSIRQPASFCGLVGLKPTYGAVSRYGLIAFASSLDQIGPLTKTVEDCRIIFDIIKGRDPNDSTSILFPESEKSSLKTKELVVGVPKEYFLKGLDPAVEKIVKESVQKLEQGGARIQEISLPHAEYALPCYYIIAPSEASSNLARYDGIKYGFSNNEGGALLDVYLKTREEGFGTEVKRRIMLGTYALSAGYYDAYYLKAQKVRTLIKEDFQKAFEQVDVIVTPTCPTPAFIIGEKKDPLSMYLSDIFLTAVNLAGLPAVSVPAGVMNGLPVGVQIIGNYFAEHQILDIAEIIQK